MSNADRPQVVDRQRFNESARDTLVAEQNRFGCFSALRQPFVQILVRHSLDMVRDLVLDSINDRLCVSLTLVVFHTRSSCFLPRSYDLECWEALNTHASTERLVGLFIAIDRSYLGKTGESSGCLFVCRFEVLTVTAPWCVESGDYYEQLEIRQRNARLTLRSRQYLAIVISCTNLISLLKCDSTWRSDCHMICRQPAAQENSWYICLERKPRASRAEMLPQQQ